MGGGKKSKAPPPPDYAAAATAQGAADKATAQYTTALDRPAQEGPGGLSTWTFTGKDINNPKPGEWKQTTYLTGPEQKIYEANRGNRLGLENLAGTAIGQAKNTLGSSFKPVVSDYRKPEEWRASGVGIPTYQADRVALAGNTLTGLQDVNESTNQFAAQGEQVRDALYQQMTRFNDERFGNAENQERTRLAQMGLQEGSQAYVNALREFNRSKDESYQGAMLNSILAGGQEQSRMVADQLAARESNIGLRQGQFGQNMARDAQDMAERLQMFNTGAQRFGMDQSERQASATHSLNLANQRQSQRQQQFNEQAYLRSLPINEISALLGGNNVNMPEFGSFAPSTPFAAPDMLGATNAQYNAAMNQYNAGQQQKGGLLGAGAGLVGSFLGGK